MKTNRILLALLLVAGTIGFANAQRCNAAFYFGSGPFSAGDTIGFTDSSTYSGTINYSWSFGDGSYSSSTNPYHSYSSGGTYVVCLTISDSSRMCSDTYCDTIVVSGSSSSSCKAEFGSYVNGKQATFYNRSKWTAGAKYTWLYGDGNSSTNSSFSHNHTYASAGTYKVTLIQYTSSCVDTICDSVVISSSSGCKAGFYARRDSSDTCKMAFVSTSTGTNSGTMYSWSFGDGSSGWGSSTSHKYNQSGWVVVCLTISDSSRNCYDTYCDTIYVSGCSTGSRCKAGFYSYRDSIDTCKTVFVSTSTGTNSGTMYSWSFGDGTSGWGSSTSHKYNQSGYVVVCLTISDSSRNCYDTYCDSIWVNGCRSGGSKCTMSVTGQIFTGRAFAQAGTVYLIEKRGNNLFAVDTTYIDSMGTYYFSGLCKGTYYVKAALGKTDVNYTDYLPTYYGNKLKWSSASTITLGSSKSGIDINMTLGTNRGGPGFIGGNVRKGANKKGGAPLDGIEIAILDENSDAVAYTYSDVDGLFEFPSLAYGKYLMVVDIPGLSSNELWVELKDGDAKQEVLVEVNSDDIELSLDGFVGIDPINASNSFVVYPNPAGATLTLDLPNFNGLVRVFDLTGKVVLEETMTNGTKTINTTSLPAGLYQVRINGVQNDVPVLGNASIVKK